MTIARRAVFVLLLLPLSAFAQGADLNITATDSPEIVGPDDDITYTVTLTNQGPGTPANTVMQVADNEGRTRFVSLTAAAGWTCNPPAPGTVLNAGFQCTHPSFANGASAVFTVVTEASDDLHENTNHNITQAFQAFSNVADPDNADNSVTVTTGYVVPHANMKVTATVSPNRVFPDGDITYTVTVTNQGPDPATNPIMTVDGSSGQTRFLSLTAPAGWTCDPPPPGTVLRATLITCTIPSLPSGASAVFTVVENASDDLNDNTDHGITGRFGTGAEEADPALSDLHATATTIYDVPQADISLTNADAPDPVAPGGTITYAQSIRNLGPDTATTAILSQSVPAGTTFQSLVAPAGWSCMTPAMGGMGGIICTKASMAPSESGAFTLVVNVTGTGTITSTVSGSSDMNDLDPSSNTRTTSTTSIGATIADLAITKTTTSTTATTGGPLNYTIAVTNAGPSPATNVVVTDTLPAGLTLVSATPSQGTCNAANPVTCNLGTIASGGSATIALMTTVTASSGTISNTASVTSSEGDTDTSTTAPIPVGSAVVAPIPTVSEWGLMMLALMLAVAAALKMRG